MTERQRAISLILHTIDREITYNAAFYRRMVDDYPDEEPDERAFCAAMADIYGEMETALAPLVERWTGEMSNDAAV